MTGYILRRALVSLPTLLGITLIAFAILNLLPSDPLLTWSDGAGPVSAEATSRLRDALRPDSGPVMRYATWLFNLLRFDFGHSLRDGRPVTAVLTEALPWTLILNLSALIAIYALGLPLGWIGARRRSGTAAAGRALLLFLSVVPPFAAALLMQRLFAVRLGLLPLQGTGAGGAPGPAAAADLLRHMVLPCTCLALAGWAYAARYARAAFRAILAPEAMAAARARGLHGFSLARHFAPNSALPFVWMVAGIVPALVSGSVVIEAIFSWPGLGQVLLRGVEGRDYPLVMALVLLAAITVLAGQLVADLILPAIDPRLRDLVARDENVHG